MPHTTMGLLNTTPDWKLHGNLGEQLRFPQHIEITSLLPDMIITSEAKKTPDCAGTKSALGREDRRTQRKEADQASGAGGGVQGQGMEDILRAHRSSL